MKSPPLRVIFDRSAFHGARYRRLQDSRLKDLCRRGRIRVFHTPVFLTETLATYGAGENAAAWRDHLQFALDVCNGGIFLGTEDIWREELVAGRGTFARHLLPERPNKKYISRPHLVGLLREVANTGDFAQEWSDTEASRIEYYQKLLSQRRILVDARRRADEIRRELQITEPLANYSLEKFRDSVFMLTGKGMIDRVGARRTAPLADQWERCPQRFPFYTAFIEGMVYTFYHAICRPNEGIDRNAQIDFELLAYLTWADIVVSNDERFFAQVFEAIWKPRGKRLETAESFAELANRIA